MQTCMTSWHSARAVFADPLVRLPLAPMEYLSPANEHNIELNWGGLAEDSVVVTQALSDLTEEAQRVCPESDTGTTCSAVEVLEACDDEIQTLPALNAWFLKPGSPWWAYRLVHLTKEYRREPITRPINLLSGCTGISSESFVMKAFD